MQSVYEIFQTILRNVIYETLSCPSLGKELWQKQLSLSHYEVGLLLLLYTMWQRNARLKYDPLHGSFTTTFSD